MTKVFLSLCIASLLVWPGISNPSLKQIPQQPTRPLATPRTPIKQLSPDEDAHQRRVFKPAKDLLEQKGVPFEPEALVDPEWRTKLAPVFARMEEMQAERRTAKQLKGVHLADTLYLPEKVELTEDTVIIARRIVHEGTNAVIKGAHHIFIYPMALLQK